MCIEEDHIFQFHKGTIKTAHFRMSLVRKMISIP